MFAVVQSLWIVGIDGEVIGGPLEVERSRPYHREWLMKFRGVDERIGLDPYRGQFVGVPADTLAPPADGEVYLHELDGFAVDGALRIRQKRVDLINSDAALPAVQLFI